MTHVAELARVLAVVRHAGVGAERDLHAGRVRLLEHVLNQRSDLRGLRLHGGVEMARNGRHLGNRLARNDRRDQIRAALLEQLERLGVRISAVLDRVDAGTDGRVDPCLAMRSPRMARSSSSSGCTSAAARTANG